MLRIKEKIDSEEGADKVLRESYQLQMPLGIPTLIIDPADYNPEFFRLSAYDGETVERVVKGRLEEMVENLYDISPRQFHQALTARGLQITNCLGNAWFTGDMVAQSIRNYSPFFNVVICPPVQDVSYRIIEEYLKAPADKVPPMPGYNAEWNFIKLWHEFGHGVATGTEEVADHVCAMVHRHVFADPTTLTAIADFRAAGALLYKNGRDLRKYNWNLVEILDRAVIRPAPETWEDVVAEANVPPVIQPVVADSRAVRNQLKRLCPEGFRDVDFAALADAGQYILDHGCIQNEGQLRISARFSIAAYRLSVGNTAYTGNNYSPCLYERLEFR